MAHPTQNFFTAQRVGGFGRFSLPGKEGSPYFPTFPKISVTHRGETPGGRPTRNPSPATSPLPRLPRWGTFRKSRRRRLPGAVGDRPAHPLAGGYWKGVQHHLSKGPLPPIFPKESRHFGLRPTCLAMGRSLGFGSKGRNYPGCPRLSSNNPGLRFLWAYPQRVRLGFWKTPPFPGGFPFHPFTRGPIMQKVRLDVALSGHLRQSDEGLLRPFQFSTPVCSSAPIALGRSRFSFNHSLTVLVSLSISSPILRLWGWDPASEKTV